MVSRPSSVIDAYGSPSWLDHCVPPNFLHRVMCSSA